MELINRKETLYRISPDQERTKDQIINYKFNQVLKLSHIPEHWENRAFADFNNTELKETADKLKAWDFKTPNIGSILSPMNGIGKTHLATCIFKKYIFEKVTAGFVSYFECDKYINAEDPGKYGHNERDEIMENFLDRNFADSCLFLSEKKLALTIQETFNDKKSGTSQLEILESYCKLDFLVIDDCFSMKENEFARQNIFYIIDERGEWKNKPTFVTSNLSLKDISGIDTRIADRLRSSLLFQITDQKINSFRK